MSWKAMTNRETEGPLDLQIAMQNTEDGGSSLWLGIIHQQTGTTATLASTANRCSGRGLMIDAP